MTLACFGTFWASLFTFFKKNFVLLKITGEGSVLDSEMRIWSIFVIKPVLKWCLNLSRSLFLYFNNLVSVTAGELNSSRGHM